MKENRHEKGQILIIAAFAFVGILAVVGLAVDGGRWAYEYTSKKDAVSAGCDAASTAIFTGKDGYTAFTEIMDKHGIPSSYYTPNVGSRFSLTKGYDTGSDADHSVFTALSFDMPTYFISFIGWHSLHITVRARCMTSGFGLITPIAVKEPEYDQNLAAGTKMAIVGQGAEANIDSGGSYRGVIFPWNCEDPNGNITGSQVYECPQLDIHWPLTENPPSVQTIKNLMAQYCWTWQCNKVYLDKGTYVPIVAGTSAAQLCQSAAEAGLIPGTKVIVMIYDGEVLSPDPSYGNNENVKIIGYGLMEVKTLAPNYNPSNIKCNSIYATPLTKVYDKITDIPNIVLYPREIPWDMLDTYWQ